MVNRQALLNLGLALSISSERIRLAYNETDATKTEDKEAAHFLKLDETRIGRDLELYSFLGTGPIGWHGTLPCILDEVLLPIRHAGLEESYQKGAALLRDWGEEIYEDDLLLSWIALFD